jgi:hypothetical protein
MLVSDIYLTLITLPLPLPPYAPNRRQSSFAGVSAACSLGAAMICSSVTLDFLISPPFVTSNAEDSHLRWYSFRGGRSVRVTVRGSPSTNRFGNYHFTASKVR